MTLSIKPLLLAAALTSSLLGCAASLEGAAENQDCGDRCDEPGGYALEVISGADNEWMRCWVDRNIENSSDPVFRRDQISCAMGDGHEDVKLSNLILAFTNNTQRSMILDANTLEDSFTVASAAEGTYPIVVDAKFQLANDPTTDRHFKAQITIEASGMSYEEPAIITQPFDLWPVEVYVEDLRSFYLLGDYEIALSTSVRSGDPNTPFDQLTAATPVKYSERATDGQVLEMRVPVPLGDKSYVLNTGYRLVTSTGPSVDSLGIQGPGVFKATPEGLQPFTP